MGNNINLAKRTMTIAGLSFQTSDIAKVALIMYIARYLTKKEEEIKSNEQNLAHHLKFKMYGEKERDLKLLETIREVLGENAVIISEASLASIALIGLNELWYADYERSKFHTINDNDAWLQMDKFGHAFTSYQLGKHGAQLLNWSGVRKKDQLIYGATL